MASWCRKLFLGFRRFRIRCLFGCWIFWTAFKPVKQPLQCKHLLPIQTADFLPDNREQFLPVHIPFSFPPGRPGFICAVNIYHITRCFV